MAVFKPVPDGADFKLKMLETFIPGCQATDVDRGPDSRIHVSIRDEVRERTAQSRTCSRKHACETVEKSARPQVFMAPGLKLR